MTTLVASTGVTNGFRLEEDSIAGLFAVTLAATVLGNTFTARIYAQLSTICLVATPAWTEVVPLAPSTCAQRTVAGLTRDPASASSFPLDSSGLK